MAGCPRLSVFWPFLGDLGEKFLFCIQLRKNINVKNCNCEKKYLKK